MITGSLPISEGVPYRLNELADLIRRARPTVDRYAAKYSFERTTVNYKGKQVSAVILSAENIQQISEALQQDLDGDRNPVISGLPTDDGKVLQQGCDVLQRDHDQMVILLESKLEASQEKVADLKALLLEQKAMYDRLIEAKDSEISTLKTSMVMLEQLKRYGALDATPSKSGPLARLGQWISGLGRPSKPAASYQQIDPVMEPVKQEAGVQPN